LVVVSVNEGGIDFTIYFVIGDPPEEGIDHVRTAAEFWMAAETIGAPGTPLGVTGLEGKDAAPLPKILMPATVKVYTVPFVSPFTVAVVPVLVAVRSPGLEVTL